MRSEVISLTGFLIVLIWTRLWLTFYAKKASRSIDAGQIIKKCIFQEMQPINLAVYV